MASTAYNSATNGLVEAFNKTIIKLLKSSSPQANDIGMRSSVDIFGPIELRFEPQQAARLFSGISYTLGDSNTITSYCFGNQDD